VVILMPIKALLWDFSGVLLVPKKNLGYEYIARMLGLSTQALIRYFDGEMNSQVDLGKITSEDFYRTLFKEQDLDQTMSSQFYDLYVRAFELNAPILSMIRSLRKNFKIGLLSNYSDRLRPLLEEHFRIADLFDDIVISCEVQLLKPDARIYHTALTRLDVQPAESIFVDDRIENVMGAEQVGLHAVHYQTCRQVISELIQLLVKNK
jgi:epoxide hydrolase-like predicted phosphatase